MAKGKSKKKSGKASQPQAKMTPEKYIKERARKLPIGKCYINTGWQEEGLAQIVVTRNRADGNFVMGVYLVDVFCLGVKDSFCNNDITPAKLDQFLERIQDPQEIPYVEAHNIIYGAIAFAEDAGIPPIKDFALTKYVLEEDTEDIPLIEYEFGKDGKYLLICGEIYPRDKMFIEPLKKRLGDNFDFVAPIDYDDYDDSPFASIHDEMGRHPREVYSYINPPYPASLSVKNQFIVPEFYDPKHMYDMPEKTIKRILSLSADEAAEDISNIIMFEIGRTYLQIKEDEEVDINQSVLLHSIIFLAHIDSNKALNAILEIMRQTSDFADYHLGDLAPEYLHLALSMAGKNDLEAIERYMYEPGLDSYLRGQAPQALAMIAANHPEKRGEIIEIFRRLLTSMVDRLPNQNACDGSFAGFVMSYLIDMSAVELIPEIKAVFDTDCVDRSITGGYDKVIAEINNPDSRYIDDYIPMTIEEQYIHLKSFDPEERK